MQTPTPKSLSWPEVLTRLKSCAGEMVVIRDGKLVERAATIGDRSSAKGTELCLFSGETPATRAEIIARLETLAKSSGRRFMKAARARIGDSNLLVESVDDESIDDVLAAVVRTRRPKLGFNQSNQSGATSTFRNKRIKTG